MTPRVSLAPMMIVVALLALDFAILAAIRADGKTSGDYAVGALPMANAVTLALPAGLIGLRRGARRPFLAGFTASGIAAVILYGAVCSSAWVGAYARFAVEALLTPLADRQPEWLDLAACALVLSLPQFLFALAGGWLAAELSGRPSESAQRNDGRDPAMMLTA